MFVTTKKGTIENVIDVVFDKDYATLETKCLVLIKVAGELQKIIVPVDEIYEIGNVKISEL